MKTRLPNLILFDIDGTLLHSYDFDTELFLAAVHAVTGRRISGDWNSYQHATDSGLLAEAFPDAGKELEQKVKEDFAARTAAYFASLPGGLAGGARAMPGAASFVQRLMDRDDCVVGIATGGWRETALMKLAHIGLGEVIDAGRLPLTTANEHYDRAEIMQLAAARSLQGSVPEKRVYFGDGEWDKRTCAALGWSFVAIGERVEHVPAFQDFSQPLALLRAAGLMGQ